MPQKAATTTTAAPPAAANGTTTTPAPKAEVQIAASMTLFNVDLFGGYDSTSKCFIIKQLHDAAKQAESYSLTDFKNDLEELIQKLTGQAQAIELPDQLKELMDTTTVSVNEVYLKISGDKTVGTSSEFAIWVELKSTMDLPVKINKLFLKAWKTADQRVIDALEIESFDKLLGPPVKQAVPALPPANGTTVIDG